MLSNKFAAALKPERPQPQAQPAVQEPVAPSENTPPSRRGAKHVGGYFNPLVSKQLRLIALEEDSSVQVLLAEALDMLFQSRQKPMIARKDLS